MAVGGLLLVGCGGDGEFPEGNAREPETSAPDTSVGGAAQADAEAYVQASAESLLAEDGQAVDAETASCVAAAHVDLFGADALAAADISPQEFADADSLDELDVEVRDDAVTWLTERLVGCEVGEPTSAAIVDLFTTEAGQELPPEATVCIEDLIDDQTAAEAVAITSIEGSRSGVTPVLAAVMATCPDVTTALIIADAPAPVTPADEACVRGILENNPDLATSAFVDDVAAARDELSGLLADECPAAVDG